MLGTPVPPLMDSLSSENSPDPLPRLPGSRGIWCESEEERLVRPPENSLEAASELETVFADSDPATQKHASIATQALREGLYDKAVASIMNLRNQENLSFEQGMTLQRELLEAAEDGNSHAAEAIKILQQFK